ncbi:MAG: HNH endonuclease signature motif containing protein [Verrucomicrobiota bacterium]
MNLTEFIEQFQDYLAPKLSVYEQALYHYIFRQSRLLGKDEFVVAFRSARVRAACGIGKGKPMSEKTATNNLLSLKSKGCIEIISTEHAGRRIRLRLPGEIPGLIPDPSIESPAPDIEKMDFFFVPENRLLILERDGHRCFYCSCKLTKENHVIEHVVSRPDGDNSYRNVVAACLSCNNKKNNSDVADFLRTLYRESFLNAAELQDRLVKLTRLKNGELKPKLAEGDAPEV